MLKLLVNLFVIFTLTFLAGCVSTKPKFNNTNIKQNIVLPQSQFFVKCQKIQKLEKGDFEEITNTLIYSLKINDECSQKVDYLINFINVYYLNTQKTKKEEK